MGSRIKKIATYDGQYDDILDFKMPRLDIMRADGVFDHIKKKHPACIKYFDKIQEIISCPDYVGTSPKEKGSFELVKKYDNNVLIGIKIDVKNNYYYVATLYDINQSKVNNRLHSGRLRPLKKH